MMDPVDEIFTKEGWIIAKNDNGKIKISSHSANKNESHDFNSTSTQDAGWVTLQDGASTEDNHNQETRQLKSPYKELAASREPITGFLLIRDLLNLKKPNSLSEYFLSDGFLVKTVAVCARVTSIEPKNEYYRLVLDDGTSAILCMVKSSSAETSFQGDEILNDCMDHPNPTTSELLRKLEAHSRKIIRETNIDFGLLPVGVPLMILGSLKEFQGKNYICAHNVRQASEEYFFRFLKYVVQSYRFKIEHVFDLMRKFKKQEKVMSVQN